MELLNNKTRKNGVDIYSDLSYHLFLSFELRLNHGVDDGKFMCRIRWRVKARVMIGSLAVWGGVYMRKTFCNSMCCLSIEQYWWGGKFVLPLSRYLLWCRRMIRRIISVGNFILALLCSSMILASRISYLVWSSNGSPAWLSLLWWIYCM